MSAQTWSAIGALLAAFLCGGCVVWGLYRWNYGESWGWQAFLALGNTALVIRWLLAQ